MPLPLARLPGVRRESRKAGCLFPSRLPSSGISISMAKAVASAIPGMLTSMASFRDSIGVAPDRVSNSGVELLEVASICLSRAASLSLERPDARTFWRAGRQSDP